MGFPSCGLSPLLDVGFVREDDGTWCMTDGDEAEAHSYPDGASRLKSMVKMGELMTCAAESFGVHALVAQHEIVDISVGCILKSP